MDKESLSQEQTAGTRDRIWGTGALLSLFWYAPEADPPIGDAFPGPQMECQEKWRFHRVTR